MNKTKADAIDRIANAQVDCYDGATEEYLQQLHTEVDDWAFRIRAHIRKQIRMRQLKKGSRLK